MAEYMSREDYCEVTCGKENREGYKTCHNCGMLNVPTAEIQPVKHGQWVDNKTCSNCGFDILYNYGISGTGFCPNCGARMDGDTE